jgi:hypothetical protein
MLRVFGCNFMDDDYSVDYYKVLGVSKSATVSEIHQAYWKLASLYHPDKGGKHEQMVLLVEAWKILSDPTKRARYDQQVKYQHDGWRSRQHNYDVQDAVKRAKDDASRTWLEFEAIYQKALYTFNQDFYSKEISEKAAGPYSPLLRPKKAENRFGSPIQKLPAENAVKTVGGLLFIFAIKVLILLLATVAMLLIYRQYAGIGRFVNLGQQGTAVISVLDTSTGAIYSVEKTPGARFFIWKKTVPPLSSQPLNRIR